MKTSGYCKYCKGIRKHKRVLNTKEYENEHLFLLSDLPCRKCNKITWQSIKITGPEIEGKRFILMAVSNVENLNILKKFKETINACISG